MLPMIGAPERIRTSDLCLRRAALYPAELRARRRRSIHVIVFRHSFPPNPVKILMALKTPRLYNLAHKYDQQA